MRNTELREGERYYLISNYTMKCRLYPNNGCAKKIDDILYAMRVVHNAALFDTFTNLANTNEYVDKNDGSVVHFPNTRGMAKAKYIKKLAEENPCIKKIPAGALQGNNGIFINDVQKMLESQVLEDTSGSKSKKKTDGKKGVIRPVESSEPHYYSKSHPRKSYTYQQTLSSVTTKENRNVLYVNLSKVGSVKVKGWNQKLRFGENHDLDFIEYAAQNPKKQITVTVSRDNCGDYWICFKLQNVFKSMKESNDSRVGIDVGISSLAVTSTGKKYENKRFKKNEKEHLKALNRRLSRRMGFANEKFRVERKSRQDLDVSKRYEAVMFSRARLERKIARKRDNHNNNISKDIVANYGNIGIESLNVSGMFRNRHLAYSLSDVAMGQFLQMIRYKSAWYGRTVKEIGRWTPSSKRCSCCGFIKKSMPLSVREWICPECKTHHDRDICASENIEHYAFEETNA